MHRHTQLEEITRKEKPELLPERWPPLPQVQRILAKKLGLLLSTRPTDPSESHPPRAASNGFYFLTGTSEGKEIFIRAAFNQRQRRCAASASFLVAHEGRILSSIVTHPNIEQYCTHNNRGPFYYLATELVKGMQLSKLLKENEYQEKFSLQSRLLLAKGIASGLDHLHTQHKIVHRDISPGNIMIDRLLAQQQPEHAGVIIDFEYAIELEGQKTLHRYIALSSYSPDEVLWEAFLSSSPKKGQKKDLLSRIDDKNRVERLSQRPQVINSFTNDKIAFVHLFVHILTGHHPYAHRNTDTILPRSTPINSNASNAAKLLLKRGSFNPEGLPSNVEGKIRIAIINPSSIGSLVNFVQEITSLYEIEQQKKLLQLIAS
ncbi:MAG: protein kinase [bacterium]